MKDSEKKAIRKKIAEEALKNPEFAKKIIAMSAKKKEDLKNDKSGEDFVKGNE